MSRGTRAVSTVISWTQWHPSALSHGNLTAWMEKVSTDGSNWNDLYNNTQFLYNVSQQYFQGTKEVSVIIPIYLWKTKHMGKEPTYSSHREALTAKHRKPSQTEPVDICMFLSEQKHFAST